MAGMTEAFNPAADVPFWVNTGATVRGGRACEVVPAAGKRRCRETSGVSSAFAGVARYDKTQGDVKGDKVPLVRGRVCRVVAAASGSAGPIVTGAGGTFAAAGATPGAGTVVGIAYEDLVAGQVFEAYIY